MRKQNSSFLSQARSYKEIGEFRGSHDLADYRDETEEAGFEVEIESDRSARRQGKHSRRSAVTRAQGGHIG